VEGLYCTGRRRQSRSWRRAADPPTEVRIGRVECLILHKEEETEQELKE